MVAEELGIQLNVKTIDFANAEHMSPEFLKVGVTFIKYLTISNDLFL